MLPNTPCHLLLPPICSYLYQHMSYPDLLRTMRMQWVIQTHIQTGTAEEEEQQATGYDRHSKGLADPTISLMFISANMLTKAQRHQTTPCEIHPLSNTHPKSSPLLQNQWLHGSLVRCQWRSKRIQKGHQFHLICAYKNHPILLHAKRTHFWGI